MTPAKARLDRAYRAYLACLNARDLEALGLYVHEDVSHNGIHLGVAGYRRMLERDFADIPDLRFDLEMLAVDPPCIASRLRFDCTPKGLFLDLDIHGLKVSFAENVFYEFADERITRVWSVIDKATIERQILASRGRTLP